VTVVSVRELDLDLDAFEGPFDLLLTLVLREELELRDVEVAEIVAVAAERLLERETVDLEACGEFLVLVSSLLELKVRELFPEELGFEDLDPDEAAEELAERLATYRRFRAAASWLEERLAELDVVLGSFPLVAVHGARHVKCHEGQRQKHEESAQQCPRKHGQLCKLMGYAYRIGIDRREREAHPEEEREAREQPGRPTLRRAPVHRGHGFHRSGVRG
jgi:chromatin segregation and condensation protein Rec8/ScpA/Scc1 (kleisin family)